jgi:hypothetical protein
MGKETFGIEAGAGNGSAVCGWTAHVSARMCPGEM